MKPSSPCRLARVARAGTCVAVAAIALGACSSRGHELAMNASCQETSVAEESARARREVGAPYFGVEFADQESALHARVADDAAPSF